MNSQTLTMFVPLILLIVAMYFLLIRPQKKKEKEVKEMRQEHQDEINKVTEALNNNTIALQKLCDKFDTMVCEYK